MAYYKKCAGCNETLRSHNWQRIYCSDACRQSAYRKRNKDEALRQPQAKL